MSETTNIAWADSTFNPWLGCTKVGPGCDGCYAEALMDRRMGRVKWGAGEKRQRTSEAYWRQPLAWNKKAAESGQPWRVFCASLADVFDNEVPAAWRWALFRLIRETPHLTWMLLTKRIGNAAAMIPRPWTGLDEFPPNVWIGATVVNQEEADRDVPKLLSVPAAVRFLSIEPMLELIDLKLEQRNDIARWDSKGTPLPLRRIDWVIVGGESDQPGHRARAFDIAWARDIVRQCKNANVPAFVKQLGSHVAWDGCSSPGEHWPRGTDKTDTGHGYWRMLLRDRASADPSEWPLDLRIQQFPGGAVP